MKVFKRKNFQALIYSIFISLPFLAVFARTAYVVCNKNAKDSYYGETINEETYDKKQLNNIEIGQSVYVNTYNNFTIPDRTTNNDLSFIVSDLKMLSTNVTVDLSPTNRILIYSYSNNTQLWCGFFNGTTQLLQRNLVETNLIFTFTLQGIQSGGADYFTDLSFFYQIEYNNYSYLDNAFTYSLNEFVQDNNFGRLDFFTFFSSLFLDSNTINNLYIHFINWYMNYILYVSLAYLLFGVLNWFVNFARRLIENESNINVGGF